MQNSYRSRDDLLAENASLGAANTALVAQVAQLTEQVATLVARVAALERRSPPPWVKPNRPPPPQPRPVRKRRPQNFARRRETPTETVLHQAASCPDCGAALHGGQVVQRRQVLDVPVAAATVTEHVVVRRRCPRCQRPVTPPLDLSATVLGQHRLSLRVMALIAQLREQLRLPVRLVQQYLRDVQGLTVSVGEIVAVLQTVATRSTAAVAQLQTAVQTSAWVHADETGWREQGQAGYIWSFSTPTVRYYRHGDRRKGMVDAVLGPDFTGVLVSDFYAAYDHYPGPHQRCWTHLLRHSHELQQQDPANAGVAQWARQLREVYEAACADPGPPPELGAGAQTAWRRQRQRHYEQALWQVCAPWVGAAVPQRVLCGRVQKYLPELFTFLADPRVPPDNNAAERSVRPVAVRRKISGGTRSAAGTLVRTTLWSLLETWTLQGIRAFDGWTSILRPPASSLV